MVLPPVAVNVLIGVTVSGSDRYPDGCGESCVLMVRLDAREHLTPFKGGRPP